MVPNITSHEIATLNALKWSWRENEGKICCIKIHKFLVMPATWKKMTMINIGTGRRCRASAMTFCPVRPSVMHNEANVSMHSMITTELILICFVVDWIDENLHNFDNGMLNINAKPTPFNVHSTECTPPKRIL